MADVGDVSDRWDYVRAAGVDPERQISRARLLGELVRRCGLLYWHREELWHRPSVRSTRARAKRYRLLEHHLSKALELIGDGGGGPVSFERPRPFTAAPSAVICRRLRFPQGGILDDFGSAARDDTDVLLAVLQATREAAAAVAAEADAGVKAEASPNPAKPGNDAQGWAVHCLRAIFSCLHMIEGRSYAASRTRFIRAAAHSFGLGLPSNDTVRDYLVERVRYVGIDWDPGHSAPEVLDEDAVLEGLGDRGGGGAGQPLRDFARRLGPFSVLTSSSWSPPA